MEPSSPDEQQPVEAETEITAIEASGEKPAGYSLKSFFIESAQIIIFALILTFAINMVTARVRVESVSMQPTLHQGELLLVNKLAYKKNIPAPGDIVVFHATTTPGEDFIKRVIGIPGDHVSILEGKVYVNGRLLNESYISGPPAYEGEYDVPESTIFVLGDNRNSSSDSHIWGNVPLENLVGQALLIYWPISEATLLTASGTVIAAP